MTLKFNATDFANHLGERLVDEFNRAGYAGTPGLIGSAREHPARKQLEQLLPPFASIGTGLVMDSFGSFSTQQDIVIHERDFCPSYSINGTPAATFFPVEGVAAVGEVKSCIDKSTLFDALDKLRSAKVLKRYYVRTRSSPMFEAADYRSYGIGSTFAAIPENEYDQTAKPGDQVYSFLLCKEFVNSADAVLDNLVEYAQRHSVEHMPTLIVSLKNGFIQPITRADGVIQRSTIRGDSFAFIPEVPRAFSWLVQELRIHLREGRTVPLAALDRYIAPSSAPLPSYRAKPYR